MPAGSYQGLWKKRQLLPCWIPQFIACIAYAITTIRALVATRKLKQYQDDLENYGYDAGGIISTVAVAGGVLLTFSILTIIFNIVECVMYHNRMLNPVVLLVFAVFKTIFWGIYFFLAVASAAKGYVSIVDIILSSVLIITSIAQLCLGAWGTHLKRKGYFSVSQVDRKDVV